jgi:hypothetical protein
MLKTPSATKLTLVLHRRTEEALSKVKKPSLCISHSLFCQEDGAKGPGKGTKEDADEIAGPCFCF